VDAAVNAAMYSGAGSFALFSNFFSDHIHGEEEYFRTARDECPRSSKDLTVECDFLDNLDL
jgi:hypothetical protein